MSRDAFESSSVKPCVRAARPRIMQRVISSRYQYGDTLDSTALQIVEQLLEVSVVGIDDCVDGATPLGFDITLHLCRSDLQVLDLLLKSGANPNGPDSAGRTPLLLLIQLIAACAFAISEEDSNLRHQKMNARQRLRLLLADPRCNVNPEPSETMQTPLSRAKDALEEDQSRNYNCYRGSGENFFNAEIVRILEQAGATDDPRAVAGAPN